MYGGCSFGLTLFTRPIMSHSIYFRLIYLHSAFFYCFSYRYRCIESINKTFFRVPNALVILEKKKLYEFFMLLKTPKYDKRITAE